MYGVTQSYKILSMSCTSASRRVNYTVKDEDLSLGIYKAKVGRDFVSKTVHVRIPYTL